ncbi:PilZ domain-containing protein [Marinobacterium lacunae]|uniref:PilZ domain-containing protein n=1 Tax=Marinobacterium lacunae TaxID=1232683 RepID=UPI00056CE51F|nr:PilZ domain-containing protein [Marinobacterium lacunae]
MKSKIFFLLSALVLFGCSEKEEITFKDIPFDENGYLERILGECLQSPSSKTPCEKTSGEDRYLGWMSYGNLGSNLGWIDVSQGGALLRVEIFGKTGELIELSSILKEKYGDPEVDTEVVRNGLGQEFNKKIFNWDDNKGGKIIIESIYDKIDSGRVVLMSPTFSKASKLNSQNNIERQKNNI